MRRGLALAAMTVAAMGTGCRSPSPGMPNTTANAPTCPMAAGEGSRATLDDAGAPADAGNSSLERVEITFRDEMSSRFNFERAFFALDDAQTWCAIPRQANQPLGTLVFSGSLPAGAHRLLAKIRYRGAGEFVSYTFEGKKEQRFEIVEGHGLSMMISAHELNESRMERALTIRFDERRLPSARDASTPWRPADADVAEPDAGAD